MRYLRTLSLYQLIVMITDYIALSGPIVLQTTTSSIDISDRAPNLFGIKFVIRVPNLPGVIIFLH